MKINRTKTKKISKKMEEAIAQMRRIGYIMERRDVNCVHVYVC